MSKLEEILRAEVDSEIDNILAEADSRAQKILSQAESRAAARVAAHRKKTDAEARAAMQKARSVAEQKVSMARVQAKGEVMDLVRQKVLASLEKTPTQPGYGQVLQALAEEALGAVKAAVAAVIHPDDQRSLGAWAKQQGLELQTDPGLRLGVRIVGPEGIAVENTLPERLRRVWARLSPELARMLWESGA